MGSLTRVGQIQSFAERDEMYRPSFQFYPGDWRRDEAIELLPLAARGLWIEMMCVMHSADPYGHLMVNGRKVSIDELARLVRAPKTEVKRLLLNLERLNVFSLTDDGIIFSRRMVRDEAARCKRAEGGQLGAEHGHKGAGFGTYGGRPPKRISVDQIDQRPNETARDFGGAETPLAAVHSDMERGVFKPPSDPPPSSSFSSSSSASPSSHPVLKTWAKDDGKEDAQDAAARLDGWMEDQIEEVLTRVAEASGLALSPAKRKAARGHVTDWLEGWEGLDLETDLLQPIRSFLAKHDGPTHSLARFSQTILDRKARAKPKPPAASSVKHVARIGERDGEQMIRARLKSELGDHTSDAWIEPVCLTLNCESLTVICPSNFHADYVANHFKPALRAIARQIGGESISDVCIQAERKS